MCNDTRQYFPAKRRSVGNTVVMPQPQPMKRTPLIFLTLALVGCADRQTSMPALPEAVVGAELNSPEPRFVFVAPDGFEWNDEHGIWHNKSIRTSVTLAHAPGITFQSIVDDFVTDKMLASGMELTSKETRDVEGRPTLMVKGNRLNARYPQQFCTVAFETMAGCAQITAFYPADLAEHIKRQIETSLLESKYESPDEQANL